MQAIVAVDQNWAIGQDGDQPAICPRLKNGFSGHHGPPRPPGGGRPWPPFQGAAAEEPAEPDPLPQSCLCPRRGGEVFSALDEALAAAPADTFVIGERASIARLWTSAIRSTSPNSTGVFRGRTGSSPTWTRRLPGSWRRWRAPTSTGTWPIPTAPTADGKRKTTAPGWDRDGPGPGAVFEVDLGRKCGKCRGQTAGSASWAGKGAGEAVIRLSRTRPSTKLSPSPGQGGDPNGLPAGEVGEHQDGRLAAGRTPGSGRADREAFPWPRAVKNPARRMLIPASR